MPKQCIKSLAISLLCAATVSSCGGSSINVSTGARDCANGYNPAQPIDVNVSSFTVDESSQNLDQTGFKPFFAAIQPNPTQSSGSPSITKYQQVADDVGRLTQPFIDYQPNTNKTDYNSYNSVRNALDFINNEIGTDDIGNFDSGRQHIAACIGQQSDGNYRNNSVVLRDISTGSDSKQADNNDKYWTFSVNWVYSPNPPDGSPNVVRVVIGLNTNSFVNSIYDPQTFSDVGFNKPQSKVYSFTDTTNKLALNLVKEYVGNNQDSWELVSQGVSPLPGGGFAGDTQAKCARVVMNYKDDRVDVYWSDTAPGEITQNSDGTTSNSSINTLYQGACLSDTDPNHFSYTTKSINYPDR